MPPPLLLLRNQRCLRKSNPCLSISASFCKSRIRSSQIFIPIVNSQLVTVRTVLASLVQVLIIVTPTVSVIAIIAVVMICYCRRKMRIRGGGGGEQSVDFVRVEAPRPAHSRYAVNGNGNLTQIITRSITCHVNHKFCVIVAMREGIFFAIK